MPSYRRSRTAGATWFFTVNLASRIGNRLLVERIDDFRAAVGRVGGWYPFDIVAMVVLPDHWHAVWTLPEGDADYSTRIRLIKAGFSRSLPRAEARGGSRRSRGERGIWQRRFWEHEIRDSRDLAAHFDYVHINPVRHGWVERVADWPYSTFHRYVERGDLPRDWAAGPEEGVGRE